MNEVRWSAPEFEYHEKTHVWFLMVWGGVAAVILFAVWQKNFLFAVFAVLAGWLVARWGKERPKDVDYELSDIGLSVDGGVAHPWGEFSGFAIHRLHHEDEGFSEFVMQRKSRLGTFFKVLMPNSKIQEARHAANHHLPEIEYEDSFIEHISRLIRF